MIPILFPDRLLREREKISLLTSLGFTLKHENETLKKFVALQRNPRETKNNG